MKREAHGKSMCDSRSKSKAAAVTSSSRCVAACGIAPAVVCSALVTRRDLGRRGRSDSRVAALAERPRANGISTVSTVSTIPPPHHSFGSAHAPLGLPPQRGGTWFALFPPGRLSSPRTCVFLPHFARPLSALPHTTSSRHLGTTIGDMDHPLPTWKFPHTLGYKAGTIANPGNCTSSPPPSRLAVIDARCRLVHVLPGVNPRSTQLLAEP